MARTIQIIAKMQGKKMTNKELDALKVTMKSAEC